MTIGSTIRTDSSSAESGRTVAGYCLAIIAIATAVIHFAVSGEHFQEYWMYGVFMLVVAWLQLCWAIAVVARPARWMPWVLWTGAVLNVGVIAVFVVTRTFGDVVGPGANSAESVGFGDVLCTVLEAIVAVGCVWLAVSRRQFRLPLALSGAVGAVTAALLSVALVAGGPEMVMSASADTGSTGSAGSGMNMPAAQASSIRLPTSDPAGDITMPDTDMQMMPGMKMASSVPCTATPTAAEQRAAVSLVDAAWADARKYQNLDTAKAAGYRPITPIGRAVVHYINPKYYRQTLLGGPVLNTKEPQSLVYANTPKGAVLVAAMYITTPGGATPRPGGCLTQWHVHTNLCSKPGAGIVGVVSGTGSTCPAGSRNRMTPPMMHVWFVPIPGGPTAIDAPDAQVVHAAEQVTSPPNGTA